MAMIACRECGAQASDRAPTCPQCGVRDPGWKPLRLRLSHAIVFGVVVAAFLYFFGHLILHPLAQQQ